MGANDLFLQPMQFKIGSLLGCHTEIQHRFIFFLCLNDS